MTKPRAPAVSGRFYPSDPDELRRDISFRNGRLLNYKRVHGIVLFDEDFPRTASLKIKRNVLAERLAQLDRATSVLFL